MADKNVAFLSGTANRFYGVFGRCETRVLRETEANDDGRVVSRIFRIL